MIYRIRIFQILRKKKFQICSLEVQADNPKEAIERSCIGMAPDRIIEIELIKSIERPAVNRICRDGVF
jgi:hypothetical protein